MAGIDRDNVKNFTDVSYTNRSDDIYNEPIEEAFIKEEERYKAGDILHDAVYMNDEPFLKGLLGNPRYDVNKVNENDRTPLHLAAKYGRKDMVEMLLNKEAKVDVVDNRGRTPLHLAAQYNEKKEIVEMLLNQGAKVDIADSRGRTPLHLAAVNGHKEVVEALLKAEGINVNAVDEDKNTPLHLAVEKDKIDIVKTLPGAEGIDVNIKDKFGEIPLHLASRLGNTDVVSALLRIEEISINATNEKGDTPLHLAAKENHEEVVKALLDKGANVDVENYNGETPLGLATEEEIKTLLKDTAALLEAAKNGTIDEVTNLISKGVSVNATNKGGKTSLHLAALGGKKGVVEFLLKAEGINVNAVDEDKNTPLHLAAVNGRKEVVEALLKAEGINVNAVDKDGKTPLDLTTKEEIRTLLKGDVQPDTEVIKKENSEEDSQSGQGISAEEGTDLKTEGVGSVAFTESAQTEEQPSSFFGNLFSILTTPFSLIASFFSGIFLWLFSSNGENADESTSQSDISLLTSNPLNDDSYDRMNTDSLE